MLYSFYYQTDSERTALLEKHKNLILVEERNTDGRNVLVFSDEPLSEKVVYKDVPVDEMEALKQSIAELTLIMAQK